MYFWRIEELKARMAAAPLSDREVLPYFLLFLAFSDLVPLFPAQTMNFWDYAGAAWTFALLMTGTVYAYWRNGGGSGVHFLQRYFAIGWVVTVRWLAVVAPISIAIVMLFDLPEETTWFQASAVSLA